MATPRKTALEFLTKAFGLHEQTRMQGPDESTSWHGWSSGQRVDDRPFRPRAHNLYSPRQTGKPTAKVNVSVDDIDGHFHRATATRQYVIGTPLQDAPWGYRHYEAVDPEGHGWHFMKPSIRPEGTGWEAYVSKPIGSTKDAWWN